jgi:hypothetical protein
MCLCPFKYLDIILLLLLLFLFLPLFLFPLSHSTQRGLNSCLWCGGEGYVGF